MYTTSRGSEQRALHGKEPYNKRKIILGLAAPLTAWKGCLSACSWAGLHLDILISYGLPLDRQKRTDTCDIVTTSVSRWVLG